MMRRLTALPLIFLCIACRPSASAVYVPTSDEVAWEAAHDAEDGGGARAAIDGYGELCDRPKPYVRACFDRVRLLFEVAPPEQARRRAADIIRRFPEEGYTQSTVKRLARSFSRTEEIRDGIAFLDDLGASLRGTEIHDTILFESARLARVAGDTSREKRSLEELVSAHDRWESQLWDDAVWRLAKMAREQGDVDDEKRWLGVLLSVRESSWLIGSYDSPYHDDALIRLGRLFFSEAKPATAVKYFDKAASIESSRRIDDALLGAAGARAALSQVETACRIIAKILSRDTARRYVDQATALGESIGCQRR